MQVYICSEVEKKKLGKLEPEPYKDLTIADRPLTVISLALLGPLKGGAAQGLRGPLL